MVGVRKLLGYIFTQYELKILDDFLPEYKRIEKMEEGDESNDYKGVSHVVI